MVELAKTAEGQARISAAADRLDRSAADVGQQYRADVPQGEREVMGQNLQWTLHFETPTEFIPMGPFTSKGQELDVKVATGPSDNDRILANDASQGPASSLGQPFLAVFAPQGDEGHEEDREQRIGADRGMDVDAVMGSIAGLFSVAEDDRRVGLSDTKQHQQGGPTESKLCGHNGSSSIAQGVSADQSKDD